jgi:hypothetical protein
MNLSKPSLCGVLIGLLLAASGSHAQNQRSIWNNATGDYEFTTAGNWGGEAPGLPGNQPDSGGGETTNAIIQRSGPVNLTSNFTAANPFDVLIIRGGLTLNVAADMDLNGSPLLLGQTDPGNLLNQTAGTVSVTNLNIGDLAQTGEEGTYNLSGGTLNATGGITINDNSLFSLQGDSASVSASSLTLSANETGADPTLDFQLGSTGVNAIALTGAFQINSPDAVLSIDGSAFTGGPGTYELVTYGSRTGTFPDPSNISLTGSFNGLQTAISYDADSLNLVLTVPEPSTVLGLLGLGAAAVMRRRRRNLADAATES